jgi:hypothetical protein
MTLTNTQIRNLAYEHCTRIVESMDYKDLIRYAIDMMSDSLGVNLDTLLDDMITWACEDTDEVRNRMAESGISHEEIDNVFEKYNIN